MRLKIQNRPTPSARRRGRSPRHLADWLRWSIAVALLAVVVLGGADAGVAAKWSGCPADPQPVYPSTLGATNTPFVHPGHELRIMLNETLVAWSGGFGVGDTLNQVDVEFAALFGDAVAVAPRQVAAASASVLSFTFPDTAAELGRVVTGPVGIRVTRGDRLLARIDPTDLVALPPATDVTELLSGDDRQQIVHAALGASGDLWVPARFHGKPMPMPGCPGDLMMPMRVQVGAATIPGATLRNSPLRRIRRASLYFGDLTFDGNDFYGVLWPRRIPLVHVAGTRGVTICRMNDALDVVVRVKGSRAWARAKRSPLAEVVRDGAAIPLLLRAALPMPDKAAAPWAKVDGFGSSCEAAPPIALENHGGPRQSPLPLP